MAEVDPLDLSARRSILMREASNDMAGMPPRTRTLEEFERRTLQKATDRKWPRANFQRQQLRHHPDLKTIYQAARFPARNPAHRSIKVPKKAGDPELLARLIEAETKLEAERGARRAAEQRADRMKIDNAVCIAREFIRQIGLTPKTA